MINPHNVMDILTRLVSERLTLSPTPIDTNKDQEVATILFDNVQSILDCTSYSLENEETLDFDLSTLSINDETTSDDDDNDDDDDYDDSDKRGIFIKQFSLEYMKNVVQFYDEQIRKTKRTKTSFSNVQKRYKRVKDKNYIRRFRKYIESQGTKQEKLNQIDLFVYNSFDNARQQLLSVHDIDLKRWGLQKGSELGDKTVSL